MTLTTEQRQELSEFYWNTDISTKELKNHFKFSGVAHRHILPLNSGSKCPNCGHPMFFKSRSARDSMEDVCCNCTHKSKNLYWCRCDYCMTLKEEQRQQEELEKKRREVKAYEELLQQVVNEEHVRWALSNLSRREKIFFRSLLQFEENDSPTWDWKEICNSAGVVSHRKYTKKLINLSLILQSPDGYLLSNPATVVDMINIKQARNISKGTRFEVFQRDNHTCQYCGRKPPDVELEIDHLIPVSKGGTDDFENLVTSCLDCNRGKSDKLIEFSTEREEWREVLRNKRLKILEDKRKKLAGVIQYWAECRNTYQPSAYDLDAIHNFIEKYEPEWIKAAIEIAVSRQPSNYVKYVGGILRNWAQNGPPKWVANFNVMLNKKKATEKQVKFIKDLLDQNGLDLSSFYNKSDYNELTMLDAHNIIDALVQPVNKNS